MDKEILEHQQFVSNELARLQELGGVFARDRKLESLYNLRDYNRDEIRNFQHERHIHLLVTITFGFIMLGSWLGLLGWLIIDENHFDVVTWLVIALVAILSILEAFYLRFYYHLENWTQKLYRLDQQIYQTIQDMLK